MLSRLTEVFIGKINHRTFFILFVISGLSCLIATNFHYTNQYPGNPVTWIGWILSMVFLLFAFFPTSQDIKSWLLSLKSLPCLIFVLLAGFFVISHLWNFETAPWNENGVFDDAAWDIYFAKKYISSDAPFQAAYTVGIAKEVMFHYFITPFFMVFGYDLLTFNYSLIVLGLTTFIFTALLIHRIFNNYIVTITSAVIFNFFPLHFLQTFVGHRYAIAAPLIMASLYFLYTGFKNRSYFRVALSSILAALCVQGAIMGKHFVMSLIAAMILYLIFNFKKSVTKTNGKLGFVFSIGFLISLIPLIGFAYHNPQVYFGHEGGLTHRFFESFGKNGREGFMQAYVAQLSDIFFGEFTWRRGSMPDFVIIPFVYYLFLIPGFIIALLKKRFEIVILAVVPIVGAFVASAYDFRVLHAAPFWIILMAFTFNELLKLQNNESVHRYFPYKGLLIVSGVVLLVGLVPSINYIDSKSKDPNSMHMLPQIDVAVSRVLRDIVAGAPNPSTAMRRDEFNRIDGLPEPDFDTFACQEGGYAITHLFLQDYGDRKIMSFCNQSPSRNLSEEKIFSVNKKVIDDYVVGYKDLKLVWAMTDKTKRIIDTFKKYKYLGSDEMVTGEHEGRSFSLYILNISRENIGDLKQAISVEMIGEPS